MYTNLNPPKVKILNLHSEAPGRDPHGHINGPLTRVAMQHPGGHEALRCWPGTGMTSVGGGSGEPQVYLEPPMYLCSLFEGLVASKYMWLSAGKGQGLGLMLYGLDCVQRSH